MRCYGHQTFPSNDSVAVASTQDGRMVLFAIASDGQPWTSFQDAIDGGGEPPIGGDGEFTFWQNLACNVFAPGPIAAGSNQDGRIQVYGFGDNNVVLTTYESGANNEGFSCPVSLGQPPLVANPTVTGVSPNAGPGGTQVTITGAGFSATPGQTSFSFGTSLATGVSCTSQTLCTAVTPSGVGTVDVIATVNGYSSSSNPPADRFTYDSCGDGPPGSPIVAIPHGSGPDSGISLQVSEPYDSGVAAFVGPAGLPASSYQVTILWGDGTSSAGSVQPISVLGAPACVVSGSHTYDRVGHYSTTVILGSPFDVAFSGQDVGVSPAQAAPMPAVGVLTSDNGPQCTATVVNLAASSDSSNPGFARVVQVLQRHFNFSGNVVVTAQHCLVQDSQGHYGFMFAPGFQGTAPAASKDFTSGIVSSGARMVSQSVTRHSESGVAVGIRVQIESVAARSVYRTHRSCSRRNQRADVQPSRTRWATRRGVVMPRWTMPFSSSRPLHRASRVHSFRSPVAFHLHLMRRWQQVLGSSTSATIPTGWTRTIRVVFQAGSTW